jgi:hypothetical protein
MNIELIYKNNSFNFDLRKDISVKYLEDMASKLISKDKSSFNLLYNNNNLSEYSNSLLKDVTQNEGTIPIVISPKINQNKTKLQKVLPKIRLIKNIIKTSNDNNDKNNVLILNNNDNEKFRSLSDESTKNILKYKLNISAKKKKQNEKKYHIKNEVFEEIYDNKENELLILMKTLSQKIKEYDDILYQKYKNDSKNRDLLLFEKNIIDFKNRQLQSIKKLINYFEEKFELNDFFRELKNGSNIKDGFRRNKKFEQSKMHSITQVNETETPKRNIELPLINYNENKPVKMLYLSQNKTENNIRIESEKEQINNMPMLKSEKKENKDKLDRNLTENLYQNIEIQDNKIYKTLDAKKPQKNKSYIKNKSIGTTKDNTNQSDSSTFSKMQEKQNYILNLNNPKIVKNENENENNINKNNSDNNEINEENIENKMKDKDKNKNKNKYNSNNDFDKKNKNNIKTNINDDHMEKGHVNDDKVNHPDSLSKNKRRLSIESINYDNKKLSCLLEDINESSNINSDSSSSNSKIESNSSKSRSKENAKAYKSGKTVKTLGNKKKERMNYSNIKNSKIGYMMKSKQRKVNQRIKKLGNNEYDFLI